MFYNRRTTPLLRTHYALQESKTIASTYQAHYKSYGSSPMPALAGIKGEALENPEHEPK